MAAEARPTSSSTAGAPTASASASRVSLACIPCRDRHVRCGAERPHCQRCISAGKDCYYTKSRRGGLDRAALAARRSRLAADAAAANSSSPADGRGDDPNPASGHSLPSSAANAHPEPLQQLQQPCLFSPAQPIPGFDSSLDLTDPSLFGYPDLCQPEPLPQKQQQQQPQQPPGSHTSDSLFDLYYAQFHRFHPFVLPRAHLEQLLGDPARAAEAGPLVSAMRYIGSFYARPCQQQPHLRQQLLEDVRAGIAGRAQAQARPGLARSPFMVQCRLLFSVAVYWTGGPGDGRVELDAAIDLGLGLGMHRGEFAVEHGRGDRVLEESWARTWWQLLVIDFWASATDRSFFFRVCNTETTVRLPCEEAEYESRAIPPSRTLVHLDNRELDADGHVYSSFAYLIDALRSASNALNAMPPMTNPRGSSQVIHEIDPILDSWLMLLPESKRDVLSDNGEVDELMFQAHMAMGAVTLSVHRPFSKLLFNPLETISTCTIFPSDEPITKESLIVHTTRCLRAIETQVRLLTLPTFTARRFSQSPFIVCMVTTGAIPLLSAIRTTLTGPKAAVARSQLRLIIACLKALADVWPRAGRYVKEIQELARLMLGSPADASAGQQAADVATSAPSSGGSGSSQLGMGPSAATTPDQLPRFDAIGCGLLASDVAAAIEAFPNLDATAWSGSECDVRGELPLW